MDFSQFDSRSAADEGRDLHLVHPATGEPLYDGGKPCIVVVRGSEGRAVQEEMAKLRSSKMQDEEDDEGGLYQVHERLVEAVRPLIVRFKNVKRGKVMAKVPDDVDWFLGLQMINGQANERSFAEQVAAFATKRANFLGVPSKG